MPLQVAWAIALNLQSGNRYGNLLLLNACPVKVASILRWSPETGPETLGPHAAVPAGGTRSQNPVSIEVAVERRVRLEASSLRPSDEHVWRDRECGRHVESSEGPAECAGWEEGVG